MKKNNRGFSLVELMISVAILGLIAAASFGFILSGTESYSSVSGSVNIQLRSQTAMNYIQEYLIDCNEAVYFSDDTATLCVINAKTVPDEETGDPVDAYTAHIFRYDGAAQAIFYEEAPAVPTGDGSFSCAGAAPYLLADGVSSFEVSLSEGTQMPEAAVRAEFYNQNRTRLCTQTVALRNHPAFVAVSYS